MTSRRTLLSALSLGLLPAGATFAAAGLTDPQAADQYAQIQRITLTQGWAEVHGVHYTGVQPGLGAGDRWSIMSNVNSDEVRHLTAMRAVVDRDDAVDVRRRLRTTPATPLRLLCAGDSITVGVGSVDGTGYRGWLAAELDRLDYAPTGLDVVVGGSGKMLDDLAAPIAAALAGGPTADPHLVLLAIGTNDSAWGNVATFGARFGGRLDAIHAAAPNAKVACAKISISHVRADPVRANAAVPANQAAINDAIATAVAARPGWTAWADMTRVAPEWLHDGGWHPGDAGYALMAREWLRLVTPWLP